MTTRGRNSVGGPAAQPNQGAPAQQPGTTVATQEAKTPAQLALANINQRINRTSFLSKLQDVLPRHIKPEAMVQAALHIVTVKPELLDCTPESIAQSVFQISMWGLEIGRTAHIVAYADQATAQQDWKGMVQRAINAGAITSCRSRLVHERDDFDIEYGLTEKLVHVPHWRAADRGKKVGVYAIAVLPGGEQRFELLNTEQVNHRRAKSKAAKAGKGPWVTDEDEMWRKTAVRLLLKGIPQSASIAEEEDEDRIEAMIRERQLASLPVTAATRRPQGVGDRGYDEPRNILAAAQAEEATVAEQPVDGTHRPTEPAAAGQVKTEVINMKDKPARRGTGANLGPNTYEANAHSEEPAALPPQDSQGYPMVAWESDVNGLTGWREMTDDERAEHDRKVDSEIAGRK